MKKLCGLLYKQLHETKYTEKLRSDENPQRVHFPDAPICPAELYSTLLGTHRVTCMGPCNELSALCPSQ